ncbi:MAG: hypothetical protein AB8G05_02240 [Oligoflexales bacterium]
MKKTSATNTLMVLKLTSILLAVLPFSYSVYAKPFTEKTERFEIDWGSLRIRFFGKGKPETGNQPYSEVEKKAWNEGLLAIRDAVAVYHKEQLLALNVDQTLAEQSGKAAGDRIASSTYSYRNKYFEDGSVVVYLENSLARALKRQDISFKQEKAPSLSGSRFSGLVIRSTKPLKPISNYKLVDETGRVLFQVTDVSKEAYEKYLMGKWFVKPSRDELTGAVGPKPVSLPMTPKGPGVFEVQGFSWKEAIQDSAAILANARIAIVSPQ